MKKLKKTSDEELLNLYQSNSEENLLNILLQRHMPQIRQNVRSLVCNKEDVEDLCQDIYSRILIKLRQGYYSNGHIQAWIYRIVQNYVYSFYRKKKHEFITQELTDLNIGDTWSDTIKEEKEKERILYVLMSILEKEPPQIKQIIKMHFYMEMTYMQISAELHLNKSTMAKRLRTALKRIKAEIPRKVSGTVLSDKRLHCFLSSPFYTISNKDGPVLPLLPYGKAKEGPVRMSFLSSYTL